MNRPRLTLVLVLVAGWSTACLQRLNTLYLESSYPDPVAELDETVTVRRFGRSRQLPADSVAFRLLIEVNASADSVVVLPRDFARLVDVDSAGTATTVSALALSDDRQPRVFPERALVVGARSSSILRFNLAVPAVQVVGSRRFVLRIRWQQSAALNAQGAVTDHTRDIPVEVTRINSPVVGLVAVGVGVILLGIGLQTN